MFATTRVLDSLTLVAPLGVRFWDEGTNAAMGEGLVVSARRPGSERRAYATTNPSAIYGFHHLPGLRDVENGTGDAAYWNEPPAQLPFLIEVEDTLGRFHPFSFVADLPHRGLYTLECGSPASGMAGVPLFSTPTRGLPASVAVIRAELWEAARGAPAAWALVEAEMNGQPLGRGLADAKGRLALFLAYPELMTPPLGASPAGAGRALWEQQWPVTLRAFYSPVLPVPTVPDVCGLLQQAPAALWANLSTATPLAEQTLVFGQALVVRSEAASVLLVG